MGALINTFKWSMSNHTCRPYLDLYSLSTNWALSSIPNHANKVLSTMIDTSVQREYLNKISFSLFFFLYPTGAHETLNLLFQSSLKRPSTKDAFSIQENHRCMWKVTQYVIKKYLDKAPWFWSQCLLIFYKGGHWSFMCSAPLSSKMRSEASHFLLF